MDDIGHWLERHGLGEYAELFLGERIGLDVLADLTEPDLKELGIPLGDRKRLRRAVEESPGTAPAPASAGATPSSESEAPTGEAERRQLTVMFCDLAGSTELSTRLDPEELTDVIRAFQDRCAGAIARYGGFIARYMGDGLLVYFGYPQAREDEPERAVRAGLDAVASMRELNRGATAAGMELGVRIGIATGQVVVGDIVGEGAAAESAVVGETPNLAARLQSLAPENGVVISASTHALLRGRFECEDLGPQSLKGIEQPVSAWRVRSEPSHEDLTAAPLRATSRAPMVGRAAEMGLLLRAWESSKSGRGQVVLVSGEAGIGKSRLVDALREELATADHAWVPVRCSPYHGQNALYPVVEQLKRAFRWVDDDDDSARLTKLEAGLSGYSFSTEEIVPLIAALLSLPLPAERYPPLDLGPEQLKRATLDAVVGWLLEESERRPVLQVWEDVHWADPSSLEMLELYIDQAPTAAVLNVVTFRPDFTPSWIRSHVTPITLNRLERAEMVAIIENLGRGRSVPDEVVEHVCAKADGVPLFVEELTKNILESDLLEAAPGRYVLKGSLAEVEIPATLQDNLMSRLDRIPAVREIAQLGAVLGREFAYEVIRTLSGAQESELREGLGRLVSAELLYQRGRPPKSRYIFKHALIQEAAYRSLLRRSRQRFHDQVAQLLERQFPELLSTQPELVAHHYSEAGRSELALGHWEVAARRAISRSAYVEALESLDRALEEIQTVAPGDARDRRELELQVSKLGPLLPVKGYGAPEVEDTSARALELCTRVGDNDTLFPILYARWVIHYIRAQNQRMLELSRSFLDRALAEQHDGGIVVGHRIHAVGLLMRGDVRKATGHARTALDLYVPERHQPLIARYGQDMKVQALNYLCVAAALRGAIDDLDAWGAQVLEHARSLGHLNSLAYALWHSGVWVAGILRDHEPLRTHGSELMALSRAHGLKFWENVAQPSLDLAGFEVDGSPAVIAERSLERYRTQTGYLFPVPQLLCQIAQAYFEDGALEDAKRLLADADRTMEISGQNYWEPEIHRLRGCISIASGPGNGEDGESSLNEAIRIAREHGMHLLELRGATELARVLAGRGEDRAARELLAPLAGRFESGRVTADVHDARVLLDALS